MPSGTTLLNRGHDGKQSVCKTHEVLIRAIVMAVLCQAVLHWPFLSAAQQDTAPSGMGGSQPSLEYLGWWVGKYPLDSKAQGRSSQTAATFFEDPAILAALKAMLPKDALNVMLKGWKGGRVEIPVEREGDVIKASFCKPHECPDANASVFVNVRTGRIEACWKRYDASEDSSQAYWYAPDAPPRALGQNEDCFAEGMAVAKKHGRLDGR